MSAINYSYALYRKNNLGQPTVWWAKPVGVHQIELYYGILGKTISTELVNTGNRTCNAEIESRTKAKRKAGYLLLSEVTDQAHSPVEESSIIKYLTTYLPDDRSNINGAMLPMLAKLYDNKDDRLYKDGIVYLVTPKMNGCRCEIGAVANQGDMFKPIKLTFQSRDGIYWNSLSNLEDHLLRLIPKELLTRMLEDNWLIDAEIYLPGYGVHDINSFVKTASNPENKLLQVWVYDLAIPEMSAEKRNDILRISLDEFSIPIRSESDHLTNQQRLVLVETWSGYSHSACTHLRDQFIEWGFEGACGRHPKKDYQYGKRNDAMWKYKAITDGKHKIVDIIPEGDKRDIPLLVLENDINDSTFKAHINGSFEYQKSILDNKEQYIGRTVFVEYGERSGVLQVPFHIKTVTLIE